MVVYARHFSKNFDLGQNSVFSEVKTYSIDTVKALFWTYKSKF